MADSIEDTAPPATSRRPRVAAVPSALAERSLDLEAPSFVWF